MRFGDAHDVECNDWQVSGQALAWLGEDQRGTRVRVRKVVLGFMMCRSGLRREVHSAGGMVGSRPRRSR
jgi:hypothetical protein